MFFIAYAKMYSRKKEESLKRCRLWICGLRAKKRHKKRGCPKRAAFFMQQILGIDFSLVDL